jgi:hypothetical protein
MKGNEKIEELEKPVLAVYAGTPFDTKSEGVPCHRRASADLGVILVLPAHPARYERYCKAGRPSRRRTQT